MKHLFALPAVLRTAALLASASQHSFSVNDDILAFPQYQVRFNHVQWTSEEQAKSRLASSGKVEELREPQHQLQQRLGKTNEDDTVHGETELVDYEQLILEGERWLCRVPRIKKHEEGSSGVNETLSKAEEEKELAAATDRGWELLSGMQDNCIYFIGGWWSYRFCYNEGVRQFHQLPHARGVPTYPPQEDPGVPGFMLGTYNSKPAAAEVEDDHRDETKYDGGSALDKSVGSRSSNGELVQRGESRYLAQTLGGGTRCDLTGKERKIEIQYHCNPQGGERIQLIKEMATCTYLMVIQTPRLCNDVAFQPPQKDQPNMISCTRVLTEQEGEARDRETNKDEAGSSTLASSEEPIYETTTIPVGDIEIGGHKLVPKGKKIEKSSIVGGGKEVYVDTLASSDGKTLSKADLERLGLGDGKAIENLRKEIEKYAAGEQWKLDVVDTARGREYRGIVGSENEEEEEDKGKEDRKMERKEGEEEEEGSEEEYFKEEL